MSSRELLVNGKPVQKRMDSETADEETNEGSASGSWDDESDDYDDDDDERIYTKEELDERWDDERWVESNKMVMGCRAWGQPNRNDARLADALTSGRCYWSGHFCKDYLFHFQNEHPLVSCFCCHPQHPYSKKERWAVLYIGSSITVCGTLMIRGMLDDWGASEFTEQMVILAFITTPVCIVELMLAQLAVLDAKFKRNEVDEKQHSSRCSCCSECCVKFIVNCEYLFFGTLLFNATLILACSIAWIVFREIPAKQLLDLWYSSRIQVYTVWIVKDFFKPCCGFPWVWRGERKAQQKRKEEREKLESNEEGNDIDRSSEVDEEEYRPPTVLNQLCSTCICFIVLLAILIYAWTLTPHDVQDKVTSEVAERAERHFQHL